MTHLLQSAPHTGRNTAVKAATALAVRLHPALLLLCLALLTAARLFAWQASGSLHGVATDPSGDAW